jgi:hypothetical protein
MTIGRVVGVVLILTAIGLAVAAIRADQIALARRVARLHQEKLLLEREVWEQEVTIARLRSPELIRDRVARITGAETPDRAP